MEVHFSSNYKGWMCLWRRSYWFLVLWYSWSTKCTIHQNLPAIQSAEPTFSLACLSAELFQYWVVFSFLFLSAKFLFNLLLLPLCPTNTSQYPLGYQNTPDTPNQIPIYPLLELHGFVIRLKTIRIVDFFIFIGHLSTSDLWYWPGAETMRFPCCGYTYADTSKMMERPAPFCSDPRAQSSLINIDRVFIGMAVGLNYSERSERHMGRLLQ